MVPILLDYPGIYNIIRKQVEKCKKNIATTKIVGYSRFRGAAGFFVRIYTVDLEKLLFRLGVSFVVSVNGSLVRRVREKIGPTRLKLPARLKIFRRKITVKIRREPRIRLNPKC